MHIVITIDTSDERGTPEQVASFLADHYGVDRTIMFSHQPEVVIDVGDSRVIATHHCDEIRIYKNSFGVFRWERLSSDGEILCSATSILTQLQALTSAIRANPDIIVSELISFQTDEA